MDYNDPLVKQVARTFVGFLFRDILNERRACTPAPHDYTRLACEDFDTVRTRNALYRRTAGVSGSFCASHEFVDANMSMHDACLEHVKHFDNEKDEHVQLFNDAWDFAKAVYLTQARDEDEQQPFRILSAYDARLIVPEREYKRCDSMTEAYNHVSGMKRELRLCIVLDPVAAGDYVRLWARMNFYPAGAPFDCEVEED